MKNTPSSRALRLVRRAGLLRPRDLDAHGIPRVYLQRLLAEGELERVSFGLYRIADSARDEHQSLAEVLRRAPQGVLCLLTALQFHGLTTQAPHEVWLALPPGAWRPRNSNTPIRVVHPSGEALTHGVQERVIGGVRARIYSPAKTVADCFKFRSRVGLDVALEALRDFRSRRGSMDELWRAAVACRVGRVMKPYLEATG